MIDLYSVSIVSFDEDMGAKIDLRGRRPSHWFPIGWWNAHREYTESAIFILDQTGHPSFVIL